jgi:hypothetical protein
MAPRIRDCISGDELFITLVFYPKIEKDISSNTRIKKNTPFGMLFFVYYFVSAEVYFPSLSFLKNLEF